MDSKSNVEDSEVKALSQRVDDIKSDTKIELISLKKDLENVIEEMQVATAKSDKTAKDTKLNESQVNAKITEQVNKVKSDIELKMIESSRQQSTSNDMKALGTSIEHQVALIKDESKSEIERLNKAMDLSRIEMERLDKSLGTDMRNFECKIEETMINVGSLNKQLATFQHERGQNIKDIWARLESCTSTKVVDMLKQSFDIDVKRLDECFKESKTSTGKTINGFENTLQSMIKEFDKSIRVNHESIESTKTAVSVVDSKLKVAEESMLWMKKTVEQNLDSTNR